ncbi:MAG: AAA family ATPase, partial [Pirellulaceae bacterium]
FDLNLDKKTRAYSSGMKQKLGLIQALMHQPDLLILDEPTTGLDPLVRKSVFAELRRIVDQGRTILFSSHSLGEVEELCDDVIILREGQVIEQEEIGILQQRALRRVTIIWPNADVIPDQMPGKFQIAERDTHVIRGNWSGSTPALLTWLNELNLDDVTIEPPDLEDLFLTYYDGSAVRSPEYVA